MNVLLGKIGGWLVVAGLLVGGGFYSGWRARGPQVEEAKARLTAQEASWDAERADAARKLAETETRAQKAVAEAEAKAAAASARIEYRTKEVVREVPVYLNAETDRKYPLSRGFVCLFNEAAALGTGTIAAESTCESPDSPSPVTESDTALTVAEWARLYYQCREEVLAWQAFYKAQQEALDSGRLGD